MNSFFSTVILLAQEAPPPPGPAPDEPSGFSFPFFITMIVIFVAFYALIGGPKRKAEAARQQAVEQMKRGTKVVSAGGIHGKVIKVDSDKETVVVEVAKGVEMTFNKNSVNIFKEPEKKDDQGGKKK